MHFNRISLFGVKAVGVDEFAEALGYFFVLAHVQANGYTVEELVKELGLPFKGLGGGKRRRAVNFV